MFPVGTFSFFPEDYFDQFLLWKVLILVFPITKSSKRFTSLTSFFFHSKPPEFLILNPRLITPHFLVIIPHLQPVPPTQNYGRGYWPLLRETSARPTAREPLVSTVFHPGQSPTPFLVSTVHGSWFKSGKKRNSRITEQLLAMARLPVDLELIIPHLKT